MSGIATLMMVDDMMEAMVPIITDSSSSQRHRRRLCPAQTIRHRNRIKGMHQGIFGKARARTAHDAIARPYPDHTRPNRLDHTGGFDPAGGHTFDPVTWNEFATIERRRLHAEQYFALCRHRRGDLPQLKSGRAAACSYPP